MRRWLFLLGCFLLACDQAPIVPEIATPRPIATLIHETSPTATHELPSVSVVTFPTPDAPKWANPITPYDPLVRAPVTEGQHQTAVTLSTLTLPQRDSIQLAMMYRGLTERPSTNPVPALSPLPEGTQDVFKVPNVESNEVMGINATLAHVSDHAYFWFDEATFTPNIVELQEIGTRFDEIYETVRFYFGVEPNPGLDGDSRLHILHVAPERLCVQASACGVAGFFSLSNVLPASVDSNSNEREMLIMNGSLFASPQYLQVLAHEFRHLIETNYDLAEETWVVEGTAVLTEHLLGNPATERSNAFMSNPNLPLHDWTTGDLAAHYGQAYLFNLYLYHRLGAETYRPFANHPADGLMALEAVTGQSEALWRDWLIALALHGEAVTIPDMYLLPNVQLRPITKQVLPRSNEIQTVNQDTADFYTLPPNSIVTFTGSTHVPVMAAHPPSGQTMWLAGRGNFAHATLTRRVNLREVQTAVLQYSIYVDLQAGRDFAHVVVSADGGATWQPLQASQMQSGVADTAFTALTPYFYTGRLRQWVQQEIDLTAYVGQEILLRFEVLTDPIVTFDGVALDQIAIPQIGFYDDGMAEGWQADGFAPMHSYLPQMWHLTHLTLNADGTVQIVHLPLDETQQITLQTDNRTSWLVVGAMAPLTRQLAHYQLSMSN